MIKITTILYALMLLGIYWGVDKYIEKKDERLEKEVFSKISEVFKRDCYIDINYSNYKVSYKEVPIPLKPVGLPFSNAIEYNSNREEEWEEKYGDMHTLYELEFEKKTFKDERNGWGLVSVNFVGDCIYQTEIFPYAVGYFKQNYSWEYNYLPSVKEAVERALDFYTKNEESSFFGKFEKGCYKQIWSEIKSCENEYYYLRMDSVSALRKGGDNLFESYDYNKYIQAGYMYNGYYKVFIAETRNPITYSVAKYGWEPDKKEKEKLWIYLGTGLSILYLGIVIPLYFIEKKRSRIKNESLYDKLIRLCNPSNFIKTYDKNKIDRANSIYEQLLNIKQDDKEALMVLQARAVSELGVILIDNEKLKDLKKKVNPQKFMKPYNAEKVKIANDLYSRLAKEDLTFDEFIIIEEESKKL